jgi:uncharacterized damage-inducible protein DinB
MDYNKSQQAVLNQMNYLLKTVSVLTDEDSTYAPAEGAMSLVNHFAHAAQCIEWFIEGAFSPNGFRMDFEAMYEEVLAVKTLSEAKKQLGDIVDRVVVKLGETSREEMMQPIAEGPIMGGVPRIAIIEGITDHTSHHRGAISVYARLLGKPAPMPYM